MSAREPLIAEFDILFDHRETISRDELWRGGIFARRPDPAPDTKPSHLTLRDRMLDRSLGLGPSSRPVFSPYLIAALPVRPDPESQLELVGSRGVRSGLKKAARQQVTRRVTREEGDLALFYDACYRPFAEQRFGPEAWIVPREEIRDRIARGGSLLLVESEGRLIAGAVLYFVRRHPEALFWWKSGLSAVSAAVPATQRMPTLEYQVLAYARERGHRILNMGVAYSLPGDGVFIHKRRLGCDFQPLSGAPEFTIEMRRDTRRALLSRVPLYVQRGRRIEAWIGMDAEAGEGRGLRERVRDARFPSLAAIRLFTPGPVDSSSLREACGEGLHIESEIG